MRTQEEITKICYRIITGITYFWDHDRLYAIRDPSSFDKHLANAYYEKYYHKFWMDLEIPSSAEVESIIIEKNIWSPKDEEKLEKTNDTIEKISKKIIGLQFKSKEKAAALEELQYHKSIQKSMLKKKNYRPIESAEYMTSLLIHKHLLFLLTFDENENRIWTNLDEFRKVDENLLNRILSASYFSGEINESDIRLVARSDPWRSIWSASIKSGNLFDHPSCRLTDYQRAVVTWSIIYDNIYEHPESPGQDIINNDDLLDAWMDKQRKERESSRNKDSVSKITSKNSKISNSKEVGIIVDSIDDAQKVYDLNDPLSKTAIRNRMSKISNDKQVKEHEFADFQQELKMEINRMQMKRKK